MLLELARILKAAKSDITVHRAQVYKKKNRKSGDKVGLIPLRGHDGLVAELADCGAMSDKEHRLLGIACEETQV